jgi:hypothetical protein
MDLKFHRKSKKNVLAGGHKKFEFRRHTEMYLVALKAQDEGKIKMPPDQVSFFICLTISQ